MKYIKYLIIGLAVMLMGSGCVATKGYLVKQNGTVNDALISDNIKLKLINEFDETYELSDVIIGYGTHPFNILEAKTVQEEIVSVNKAFNNKYKKYSKNGIEKDFLGYEFMTFTDEALLGMLADEYGMKLIVVDGNQEGLHSIDYSKSHVKLTKKIRQNIYYGFSDTLQYYEDREKDE